MKNVKELVITKNNIEEVTNNIKEYVNINLRVEDVEVLEDIKKAIKTSNVTLKTNVINKIIDNDINNTVNNYLTNKDIEVLTIINNDNMYKIQYKNYIIPFKTVLTTKKDNFKECKLFYKAFHNLISASIINALNSDDATEKSKVNYFKKVCDVSKFNSTLSNNNIVSILQYLYSDILKFEGVKVCKKHARVFYYSLTKINNVNKNNVNIISVNNIIQYTITLLNSIINDINVTVNGK